MWGKPRQCGGLTERKPADVLSKVGSGRRLDAVGPVTEVDRVQVHRQDVELVEAGLQAPRQDSLSGLAYEAPLVPNQALADLLRERGRPLDDPAGAPVRERRAGDAAPVDPTVLKEALVLGGQERLDEAARDTLERHDVAALARQLRHDARVVCAELRDARWRPIGERLDARQVAAQVGVQREATDAGRERAEDARDEHPPKKPMQRSVRSLPGQCDCARALACPARGHRPERGARPGIMS